MKILIVAGGTGGHLYPGIAVAHALKGHHVTFCVRRGDLGRDILDREGFQVEEIVGQGLPRTLSLKALAFPFQLARGFIEARILLKRCNPDAILSMGGYLSVPIVVNGRWMDIPTLLHEQNVFPGVANRLLSRWVNSVAVSFSDSVDYFKGRDVWISGLPIRRGIGQMDQAEGRRTMGLAPDVATYLVFGGSLGARHLNTLVLGAWELLVAQKLSFQVLHVTGPKDFERMQALYAQLKIPAKVLPYSHQMAAAYAAASAILCRAGASTVAELQASGRPALLVPYPFASANHQLFNAKVLEKTGQGEIVLDSELTAETIAAFFRKAPITNRIQPPSRLRDSASSLAARLTSLAS